VQSRGDGLVTPTASAGGWRRLVYVRQARKQLPTHLESFDYPQMNPNCLQRRDSTVAPQALYLMNNGMVHDLAEHFARRVRREAGPDPARQVERVYWIALGRPADAQEKAIGVEALNVLGRKWARHPGDARLKALATYCHAIVNSAGFLYVD
jgi:hypothetical protein